MECLASETVWIKKSMYQDAEKDYFEQLSKVNKKSKNLHDSTILKKHNKSENQNLGKKTDSLRIDRKHSEAISKLNKTNFYDDNRPEESKKKHHGKHLKILVSEEVVSKPVEKSNCEVSNEANASDTGEDIILVEKNKPKKKKKKGSNKNKSPEKLVENQIIIECEEKNENYSVKQPKGGTGAPNCTLVSEIAKARQHIKNSLEKMDGIAALVAPFENSSDLTERVTKLEKMYADLQKQCEQLAQQLKECKMMEKNGLSVKEKSLSAVGKFDKKQEATNNKTEIENDDGVDLFASDSEDDKEADAIREQRLAAYNEKKSKKPALIAKSSVVFDIKPWDDETDMKQMEIEIRKITAEGLVWGSSKLQLVAFGIKKLVLISVVEDEKVSIDWLVEEIQKLEDYVQSVDIAAFNKI